MKHRFRVPSELAGESLHAWLRGRGWRVIREELQYLGAGGVIMHVMIQPMPPRSPVGPHGSRGAVINVCSGAILVYDDVEQSLGVTMLAEPRDAVPTEPEDAALPSPTEPSLDPRLPAERRGGRRRR